MSSTARLLAPLARQFAAFFGVGLVAAVVHYGLLIGLIEAWRVDPVTAALAGYVAGGVVSYSLNRQFTYRSDRPHAEATWRFALVAVVGFFLTWGLMHAFTRWFGLPYLPAQIVTTAVVLFWSFLAHKLWTFADRLPPHGGRGG